MMANSKSADNTVNDAIALYKMLKTEWDRSGHSLEKCEGYLSKLKIYLTKLAFLPILHSAEGVSKQELIVARDVLEIGALYSIETKDNASFERYLAQLKCYYFDYRCVLVLFQFLYPSNFVSFKAPNCLSLPTSTNC